MINELWNYLVRIITCFCKVVIMVYTCITMCTTKYAEQGKRKDNKRVEVSSNITLLFKMTVDLETHLNHLLQVMTILIHGMFAFLTSNIYFTIKGTWWLMVCKWRKIEQCLNQLLLVILEPNRNTLQQCKHVHLIYIINQIYTRTYMYLLLVSAFPAFLCTTCFWLFCIKVILHYIY